MSGRVDSMVWIPRHEMAKYNISATDLRLKYKEGYGMAEQMKVLKLYVPREGEIGIPRSYFADRNGGFQGLKDLRSFGEKVDIPFLSTLRPRQVKLVGDFLDELENSYGGGGILCAACGAGKCVSTNTLVFTGAGLVEAGEMVPEGSGFHTSVIHVDTIDGGEDTDAVYNGGMSKTIRVTTRFGYEIEGTPEHPIMVFNEGFHWRRLSDIREGDFVVIKRGTDVWGSAPTPKWCSSDRSSSPYAKRLTNPVLDATAAEAIGLIVAEGYLAHCVKRELRFSNSEEENVSVVRAWLATLGLHMTKNRGDNVDYTCCSVNLRRFLHHLGVDYGVSKDRVIPIHIRSGGKNILAAFLRGYIEGDGGVSGRTIEISSAS
ncbi:MAG: hypothetical protein ABIH23_16745, partial [bacterium]